MPWRGIQDDEGSVPPNSSPSQGAGMGDGSFSVLIKAWHGLLGGAVESPSTGILGTPPSPELCKLL